MASWLLAADEGERIEPAIELLDIGLFSFLAFTGVSLYRSGDAGREATNKIRGYVTQEHEKTRQVIENPRSSEYGLSLLRESSWKYNPNNEQFYCDKDTDWTIIQDEENHRNFYEPWLNNLTLPDPNVVVYRTILKRNATEVRQMLFLDLDGGRKTMPVPQCELQSDKSLVYYYCEGSFEHLMFNIVKQSYGTWLSEIELKHLAWEAEIEWRECDTEN